MEKKSKRDLLYRPSTIPRWHLNNFFDWKTEFELLNNLNIITDIADKNARVKVTRSRFAC